MVFSSNVFLFLFLPIFLLVYLALSLPRGLGYTSRFWRTPLNLCLLLASLVFYAWGEPRLIVVMLAEAVIDFCCGIGISGAGLTRPIEALPEKGARSLQQKVWLGLSLLTAVGLLGSFKYSGFVIESYNGFVGSVGLAGMQWAEAPQLALPLGISFYTFQSLSYTIDVYRGKVKATRNPLDYLCFVTLFPQLIAGPIVRYATVAHEVIHRTVSMPLFASGVQRFIMGLGKKVLVANMVAVPADKIFALPSGELTTGLAWIGIISYTLQIYFDFSGYSDMAIGLGRMVGFHFPENFNYPYTARSVTEFWRRWHISLSTWFRDYLYIPLGGNRHGSWRTYRNLIVVFFLCGLWHGAYWTFIAWGVMYGFFLVIERVGLGLWLERVWRPIGHMYTVLVVMVSWVLFRSDTLPGALSYLKAMAGFGASASARSDVWMYVSSESLFFIAVGIVLSVPVLSILSGVGGKLVSGRAWGLSVYDAGYATVRLGSLGVLFLWCAAKLSAGTYNPFIYFRF